MTSGVGLIIIGLKFYVMGKSKPGLFTPVTGKVGGVVFYYRNGRQVQRIWVKPTNPKTKGQSDARLRMVLAGKLSSVVPFDALEGFGGSKSDRRSRFNSTVMRNADVEAGSVSIPFGKIMFSEGTLGVSTRHSAQAGEQGTGLRRVVLRCAIPPSGSLPEGYGERYVVMLLNNATSAYDYCQSGLMNMPSGEEFVDTVVEFRGVGDVTSTYTALFFVYPFLSVADTGSGSFSYIGTGDGTVVVDLGTGERIGAPQVYGSSLFVRSVELVPPTPTTMGAAGGGDVAVTKKK